MSEAGDALSRAKISRAVEKSEDYECFVDGKTVGMSDAFVPCILSSVAGQTAKVVLADGHDTGVEVSVPLGSVSLVSSDKMGQVAKDLFRGE